MCLNKLGARIDLFLQSDRTIIQRRSKGIGRGAEKDPRRCGQLAAAQELTFIAHRRNRLQEANAVEVKHRFGIGLIAGLYAVTSEAQDIGHTHSRGAEHIPLNRNAVAVTA